MSMCDSGSGLSADIRTAKRLPSGARSKLSYIVNSALPLLFGVSRTHLDAYRLSEVSHDPRHLLKNQTRALSRAPPLHRIPQAQDVIVDGEHVPFKCRLAHSLGSPIQEVKDYAVIAIQRFPEAI